MQTELALVRKNGLDYLKDILRQRAKICIKRGIIFLLFTCSKITFAVCGEGFLRDAVVGGACICDRITPFSRVNHNFRLASYVLLSFFSYSVFANYIAV